MISPSSFAGKTGSQAGKTGFLPVKTGVTAGRAGSSQQSSHSTPVLSKGPKSTPTQAHNKGNKVAPPTAPPKTVQSKSGGAKISGAKGTGAGEERKAVLDLGGPSTGGPPMLLPQISQGKGRHKRKWFSCIRSKNLRNMNNNNL